MRGMGEASARPIIKAVKSNRTNFMVEATVVLEKAGLVSMCL
jgi:hypothetical protein